MNILKSKKSCSLPSTDSYSVDLLNFPPLFDPQVPIMNSSNKKKSATWSHHQTQLPPSTRIQGRKVLFVPANQFSHSRIATDAVICKSLQTYWLQRCQLLMACGRFVALRQAKIRVKSGENVGLNFFWRANTHFGRWVGNTAHIWALN